MKNRRSKAGFTLVEMIATVLILVMLFAGVGVSMDVGTKIYYESIFESDSSLLAETLNTHLTDILSNATDITINPGIIQDDMGNNLSKSDVPFLFSSSSYGVQDAYLQANQTLVFRNKWTADAEQVVNTGAYPNLTVKNFKIEYHARNASAADGSQYSGYCIISYTIVNSQNSALSKDVRTVVRLLNDP